MLKKDQENKYVVGFAFNDAKDELLLIRKKRPKWQAGLLNGIGGKIKEGESRKDAMKREFLEETGIFTWKFEWEEFFTLSDEEGEIHFFTESLADQAFYRFESTTDETVVKVPIKNFEGRKDTVPNLTWLVPMALEHLKLEDEIKEGLRLE